MSRQDVPAPAQDRGAEKDSATSGAAKAQSPAVQPRGERGGPKGPEPTRYGDWEKGGRCFDF